MGTDSRAAGATAAAVVAGAGAAFTSPRPAGRRQSAAPPWAQAAARGREDVVVDGRRGVVTGISSSCSGMAGWQQACQSASCSLGVKLNFRPLTLAGRPSIQPPLVALCRPAVPQPKAVHAATVAGYSLASTGSTCLDQHQEVSAASQ